MNLLTKLKDLFAREGIIVPVETMTKVVKGFNGSSLMTPQICTAQALRKIPESQQERMTGTLSVLELVELVFATALLPSGFRLERTYLDNSLWVSVDGVRVGELNYLLGFKSRNNCAYDRNVAELDVLLNLSHQNLECLLPSKDQENLKSQIGCQLLSKDNLVGLELDEGRVEEFRVLANKYKELLGWTKAKSLKTFFRTTSYNNSNALNIVAGIGRLTFDNAYYSTENEDYSLSTYESDGKTFVTVSLNNYSVDLNLVKQRLALFV